jgi:hypothetical protein
MNPSGATRLIQRIGNNIAPLAPFANLGTFGQPFPLTIEHRGPDVDGGLVVAIGETQYPTMPIVALADAGLTEVHVTIGAFAPGWDLSYDDVVCDVW